MGKKLPNSPLHGFERGPYRPIPPASGKVSTDVNREDNWYRESAGRSIECSGNSEPGCSLAASRSLGSWRIGEGGELGLWQRVRWGCSVCGGDFCRSLVHRPWLARRRGWRFLLPDTI